jgi:glycosyltransferase involved in cell wall biosynthesis
MIEAFFSGTPVISTDWGSFAENNLHGITGYRCRTMEQFVWATKNIHKIKSKDCRYWAMENYSLERVAQMYDEYFDSLHRIKNKGGWYHQNPEREELDWMTRKYPKNC